MIAAGSHTYYPGFEWGLVRAGFDVVGSRETWKDAIKARHIVGRSPLVTVDRADLVFSNPPCSRYSSQSSGAYSQEDKDSVENFCDLGDGLRMAIDLRARCFWWETGPLMWIAGRGMARSAHAWLVDRGWPKSSTTFVIKYDPRWHGMAQRRPRCHVIHLQGSHPPPSIPKTMHPATLPAKQRLQPWLEGAGIGVPCVPRKHMEEPFCRLSPVHQAELMITRAKFIAMAPKFTTGRDAWFPACTARLCVWEDEDRWWGLNEWTALMTYPIEWTQRLLHAGHKPGQVLTLLSKSVAPESARWVAEHVVIPALKRGGDDMRDSGAIHRQRMFVPDVPRLVELEVA